MDSYLTHRYYWTEVTDLGFSWHDIGSWIKQVINDDFDGDPETALVALHGESEEVYFTKDHDPENFKTGGSEFFDEFDLGVKIEITSCYIDVTLFVS